MARSSLSSDEPPITITDIRPNQPQLFHDDYVFFFKIAATVVHTIHAALMVWTLYRFFTDDGFLWPVLGYLVFLTFSYVFLSFDPVLPRADWKTEIILITGGGSGLGADLALRLRQKTKVVVLTLEPPSYGDDNRNIYTYICDVSDRAAVAEVAARIRNEVGEPTTVVNNAGIMNGKLLLDLTAEDIERTFKVNAIAPYYIVQEFLPAMLKKKRGHIINVASILGLMGNAQLADYCGSKAGLVSMHESLRKELDYRYKTPEVRTTLVLPCHIKTALFKDTLLPQGWVKHLAGSLTTSDVVEAILDTMAGGSGALNNTVLRLPSIAHSARLLTPFAALVPSPMCRVSEWVSGQHWAMKPYGPSPDAGERLEAERRS